MPFSILCSQERSNHKNIPFQQDFFHVRCSDDEVIQKYGKDAKQAQSTIAGLDAYSALYKERFFRRMLVIIGRNYCETQDPSMLAASEVFKDW